MIEDFRDPAVGADRTADLCIIGAGPAGLAIAHKFLGTGRDVLVIESGGRDASTDADALNTGDVVGLPFSLVEGRARAFGGTGTRWPGQCIRMDQSDFEARDWVPKSGWPMNREHLQPFYDRAAGWIGIPPHDFDEQAWVRYGLTPPAFRDESLEHRSSTYSRHPDVGAHYRHLFEQSDHVRFLLNATATRIDDRDAAETNEIQIRSLSGRTGRIRARTTVICGGGIENARLLLLSGFGEKIPALGRFLQDHPTVWFELAAEQPKALQEFYGWLGRGKVRYYPRIRLGRAEQRKHHVLNAVATLIHDRADTPGVVAAREISSALQGRRRPRSLDLAGLRGLLRELDGVAVGAFSRFARGRPSATPWERTRVQILLEQAPNLESRITLSAEKDELGLARARIDWRLTELERRTVEVFVETLDSEFRRLGIGSLTGTEWLGDENWDKHVEDAYHPIGTTRMSIDPADGVVDADCQVHGYPGVYVCGGSVFPTSGYANPTLTIVALALRLADHLGAGTRANSWT